MVIAINRRVIQECRLIEVDGILGFTLGFVVCCEQNVEL
jgi:hypothetical protein